MAVLGVLAILALVLANAFFVLGEFSLISVDRGKVDARQRSGDARAGHLLAATRDLTRQLSGAQFGITLCSLLLGFVAEPLLARLAHPLLARLPLLEEEAALVLSVGLALLVSTYLQMVVGEQVPKAIAIAHPLRTGLLVAGALRAFCRLTSPAVHILNSVSNAVVRRVGVEPKSELVAARSVEELEAVIRESAAHGSLDRDTARLLSRALRFGSKTVSEAMTPRVAVVALPATATVAQLLSAAASTGHTGIPIYGDDREQLVGLVRVEDALSVEAGLRATTSIRDLVQPALVVPESTDLPSLLESMRRDKRQFAVVVDEYGGLAGIATDEDVLEEIVGEIDEGQPGHRATRLAGLIQGGAHQDQVLEDTGFPMPDSEGQYETLAGFLLSRLGHIPEAGETVTEAGWTLEVAEMDGNRIAWVRVLPPRAPAFSHEGGG